MADIDLDELERIARAATHGLWRLTFTKGQITTVCRFDEYGDDDANATHIATFDPQTILSLIALVRTGKENERKAWIAGRDAAAEAADAIPNRLVSNGPEHVRGLRGSDVAEVIRALTPPAETSP